MLTDIYDLAVAYLIDKPDQILVLWDQPYIHPAGLLFQVASPTGDYQVAQDGIGDCGEICEIISGDAVAFTSEMTEIILEDERLPIIIDGLPNILKENLQDTLEAFAEWQRLFDMTWNRNPLKTLKRLGLKSL